MHKKHFVGTCVNSFDEDGDCVLSELPWSQVSDFAFAGESAMRIAEAEFMAQAIVPKYVHEAISLHEIEYLRTEDEVLMLYDISDDVHYFFA